MHRKRLLHLPVAILVAASAMGTTCEENVDIDAEVHHEGLETLGHVLFVTIYPASTIDANGLPQPTSKDAPPEPYFVKHLNSNHDDDFRLYLISTCFPQTRIVAWIDMNDNTGMKTVLEPGQEVDQYSGDPVFDFVGAAFPDKDDWIAISEPIDADVGNGRCKNDSVNFELTPGPLK